MLSKKWPTKRNTRLLGLAMSIGICKPPKCIFEALKIIVRLWLLGNYLKDIPVLVQSWFVDQLVRRSDVRLSAQHHLFEELEDEARGVRYDREYWESLLFLQSFELILSANFDKDADLYVSCALQIRIRSWGEHWHCWRHIGVTAYWQIHLECMDFLLWQNHTLCGFR